MYKVILFALFLSLIALFSTGYSNPANSNGPTFVLNNNAILCTPSKNSANGSLIAKGKEWVMTNIGGAGIIKVTANAIGDTSKHPNIVGAPADSSQFSVGAGETYVLVVALPVNVLYDPKYCAGLPSCSGPAYGPRVKVSFSGMPSISDSLFSFVVAAGGPYSISSANGQPIIGLKKGSATMYTTSSGFIACLPVDSFLTAIFMPHNIIRKSIDYSQPVFSQFNRNIAINSSFSQNNGVIIKIFYPDGREITTLINGSFEAGKHCFIWNTNDVSAGCYIVRSQFGSNTFSNIISVFR